MSDLHERLSAALSERYELDRELGRGGMAVVYLARDLKQGRQVALKVFQPDIAAAMGPARFRREIEIATRLEHPHILSLYDSGEAEGLLYYVMPYVKEESLRQRLDREGQLPIEDALRIAREMAEALDYAHDQGVVHRDVKPGNVLLQRGHALLADFGVARALEASGAEKLTGTGVSVGTPQYMAPEQVTGADTVDGRADVYAAGAVLYEMLTGEAPYTGSTPHAILAKRMAGPPTPIPVLRETVSPDLDSIVQQAMARSAADRWQSARDLAKALAAAERGDGTPIPGLSTRPGVTAEVTAVGAKPKSGRWVGPAVAVAAVMVVVVGGLWYSVRETGEPEGAVPDPMLVLMVPERPVDVEEEAWTRILADKVKLLGDLDVVPLADARFELRDYPIVPTRVADSVAAGLGAGKLVMVNTTKFGDGLRLNVSLRATGDPALLAEVDTTVRTDDLGEWAPAVVVQLFENQETGLTSEANVSALNTGSALPEAQIAASRGAAYWGRGQYDSAMISYQRAVEIDPDFVNAWGRLSWAAAFSSPRDLPWGHDSLRAHAALADSARNRFESLGGLESDIRPTLEEARRDVRVQPENAPAWQALYDVMLNEYWRRGWEPDSVLAPLLKSIELDPHDAYKPFLLCVYHAYTGNLEGIRDVLVDAAARGVSVFMSDMWETVAAFALGNEEKQDSVLANLPPNTFIINVVNHRLFLAQNDMDLSARFAEVAFATGWPPLWLIRFSLAGGQWREAVQTAELDDNERAQFGQRIEGLGGMAATGVLELPPEEVLAAREAAQAYRPADALEALVRLHRLGLLSARLSEYGTAQEYADSLDAVTVPAHEIVALTPEVDSPPSMIQSAARDAALEVRALAARLSGRPEAALEMLKSQTFEDTPAREFNWVTARTYGRFLRAELLFELGRYEEAVGWYATIPRLSMGYHLEALLLASVFRGRARSLDALGRYDEALHYYRRFVTRWQDADPHLQPQVEEARQRIRELEEELN